MRILGVDPGSRITGYGVIERKGSTLTAIASGDIVIKEEDSFAEALRKLYDDLAAVVAETRPDALAMEQVFFGKNVKSLIRQAHARGVAMLAGAEGGIPVFEYSPLEVKKAVVGYGQAEKAQVARMVKAILHLPALPKADAGDALAVAICHANANRLAALMRSR